MGSFVTLVTAWYGLSFKLVCLVGAYLDDALVGSPIEAVLAYIPKAYSCEAPEQRVGTRRRVRVDGAHDHELRSHVKV